MSALTDVFTAIANAIRSKNGLATTYKPNQMAQAISEISTGVEKKAEGFLLGGLGVAMAINGTGDKFALYYPFGIYQARSIVYNNLGGLDDFLIGTTDSSAPLFRCLTDWSLQAITLSGFTGQIARIRKFDNGSYTNVSRIYMCTNQNNKFIHSLDGTTFTVETMSGSGLGNTSIKDIAYSSFVNILVAVPSGSNRSYLYYRSGNGASNSWSIVNLASSGEWTGIAYGHRHFILIGNGGKIQYSTDGTTWWNLPQSYTTADLTTIEYVDEWSAFIIGYSGGTLIIEINAQSTSRTVSNKTITDAYIVNGIAYHKQLGVAVAVGRKTTNELLYCTLNSLSYSWKALVIGQSLPNAIAFK